MTVPKPTLITDVVFGNRRLTSSYQIERTWILAEGPGAPSAWPLSSPSCEQCYDMPPPGFTCNECGAGASTPEPVSEA